MQNNNQLQQGDILLQRLPDNFLKGKKIVKIKKDKRGIILEESKTTNHYHGIKETGAELIKIGKQTILKVTSPANLRHQEHGSVTIPPGFWEIGGVVEKDWLSGMVNRVID